MIFSAKCEYGIKAMLDLSINGKPDRPVQVRIIADRADIPEGFLEQIMADLRKAGLVESIRGAHGGYVLSKPAEAINLADVIEAIDGPVTPGGCLRESVEPNSTTSIAVIQDVWLDVRDCVMDVLSTMDLAHLREKLLRKNGATLALGDRRSPRFPSLKPSRYPAFLGGFPPTTWSSSRPASGCCSPGWWSGGARGSGGKPQVRAAPGWPPR